VSGTPLVITAGQEGNPCCPCCPTITLGCRTTAGGFAALGSTTTPTLFGDALAAFVWGSGSGQLNLLLVGLLPQNLFTLLTVTDSILGSISFTSASATYSQIPGAPSLTVWAWVSAKPFNNGATYHSVLT